MSVLVRENGGTGYDYIENNQQSYSFDTHVRSTSGAVRVYVHIVDSGDTPKVRLYLYGLATNLADLAHTHTISITSGAASQNFNLGATSHTHSVSGTSASTGSLTQSTSKPLSVKIYIDGVEKTATIGDQNSKGAAHYHSTNNVWGVSGEWETGELDLSDTITWDVSSHFIEMRCSGTGGRLCGSVLVN